MKPLNNILLLFLLTISANAKSINIHINNIKMGQGDEISKYDTVTLHYKGWLSNGVLFDDTYQRNKPIVVTRGTSKILPGWELALNDMKVGGIREFTVPPSLAFGKHGVPGVIPKNETLKFLIEVIATKKPPFTSINKLQLETLMKTESIYLIDIRREDEWISTGVIKDSILLTAFDKHDQFNKSFRQDLDGLIQPNSKIVLICRSGRRTGLIARALVEQAGFKNVFNLADGINGWKEVGGKLTRSCPKLDYGSTCSD